MSIIVLFLVAAFVIIPTAIVVSLFSRAIRNKKKWNEGEPRLIEDIEKSTGQKVVFKIMLNASRSMDFRHGNGFWLWMAFLTDCIAFALRDEIAGNGEGSIFIVKRKDTSIRRLEKHYVELEVKSEDASDVLKFVVFVNESEYEALTRFVSVQ